MILKIAALGERKGSYCHRGANELVDNPGTAMEIFSKRFSASSRAASMAYVSDIGGYATQSRKYCRLHGAEVVNGK